MKRLFMLLALSQLVASCSKEPETPAESIETWVSPEEEVQVASEADKIFLDLDGAKNGDVFKYADLAESEYSFVIFDHYPNGRDDKRVKATISMSIGCRGLQKIRVLHGLEACRTFISSIEKGAFMQQLETCCCPRSWNTPEGHSAILYDLIESQAVDLKQVVYFDSCFKGKLIIE